MFNCLIACHYMQHNEITVLIYLAIYKKRLIFIAVFYFIPSRCFYTYLGNGDIFFVVSSAISCSYSTNCQTQTMVNFASITSSTHTLFNNCVYYIIIVFLYKNRIVELHNQHNQYIAIILSHVNLQI